jgi:hypothetical protein
LEKNLYRWPGNSWFICSNRNNVALQSSCHASTNKWQSTGLKSAPMANGRSDELSLKEKWLFLKLVETLFLGLLDKELLITYP